MAIRRITTSFAVGLFIFAAQGSTNGFAAAPTSIWDGVCSCNISGPGFNCHFQHWVEAFSANEVRSKCAAQSHGHGVLSRLQGRELRFKKRH